MFRTKETIRHELSVMVGRMHVQKKRPLGTPGQIAAMAVEDFECPACGARTGKRCRFSRWLGFAWTSSYRVVHDERATKAVLKYGADMDAL